MSSADQIDPAVLTREFVKPPVSRHAMTFVLITVFLDMVGFGIIIPVMPTLIGMVGKVTLAEAAVIGGWMAAAYSLTQFLFGPLMGNLSDRFGRRPLLLLAIFGLGLNFLLQAVAPSLDWLFVARILAGLCGASWVIANAYIADVTPPEGRGKAYGVMGAAFGLGFVIGPAVVVLMFIHGPEGFVYPMLTAIMSKRVPENAQGELQGGLSSLFNIAALAGTVFYAQIFGYFWGTASPWHSPNIAFYVAGAGLVFTMLLFLWLVGHDGDKT